MITQQILTVAAAKKKVNYAKAHKEAAGHLRASLSSYGIPSSQTISNLGNTHFQDFHHMRMKEGDTEKALAKGGWEKHGDHYRHSSHPHSAVTIHDDVKPNTARLSLLTADDKYAGHLATAAKAKVDHAKELEHRLNSEGQPLPKTLRSWLVKHHSDKVDTGSSEYDGFNERGGPSHWVYLKPGHQWDGAHSIHECSTEDVKRQFNRVKPCDCEDCTKSLKRMKRNPHARW